MLLFRNVLNYNKIILKSEIKKNKIIQLTGNVIKGFKQKFGVVS